MPPIRGGLWVAVEGATSAWRRALAQDLQRLTAQRCVASLHAEWGALEPVGERGTALDRALETVQRQATKIGLGGAIWVVGGLETWLHSAGLTVADLDAMAARWPDALLKPVALLDLHGEAGPTACPLARRLLQTDPTHFDTAWGTQSVAQWLTRLLVSTRLVEYVCPLGEDAPTCSDGTCLAARAGTCDVPELLHDPGTDAERVS